MTPTRVPAPSGIATGVGSLPGDDIDTATALVFDALPDLPHLPELPARGPGADMVGRTATILADLPVDLQPSGWRLVSRGGFDRARGRDLLATDLDALIPVAGPGYDGRLKVALTGPWTLAASLELPRGGRALGDPAAVADLAASLAETVREHLVEVGRRVPDAQLVLQLDEPALPAILAGRVPTESGFGRYRELDPMTARPVLAEVVAAGQAAGVPVVLHCCAASPPLRLFGEVGASAVSFDASGGRRLDLDVLGELVEGGTGLWLGLVPGVQPAPTSTPWRPADVAAPVRQLWNRLGFDTDLLTASVSVTPACGLAGASPQWAAAAYRLLREGAQMLAEAPEGIRS